MDLEQEAPPAITKKDVLMNMHTIFDLLKKEKSKLAAIDVETTGLDWREDWIIGVGLAGADWEGYVPFTGPYAQSSVMFFRKLKPYLADETWTFIMHNLSYDAKLLMMAGMDVGCGFEDTKILSWCLDENTGNGLKECAMRDLGVKMTKFGEVSENKNDLAFCKYGQDDPRYTYDLCTHYLERLEDYPMIRRAVLEIEYPVLTETIKMEMNGVTVDIEKLKIDRKFYKICQDKYQTAIYKMAGEEFNINSSDQLRVILFEKLKLPTKGIKLTGGGKKKVKKKVKKVAKKPKKPELPPKKKGPKYSTDKLTLMYLALAKKQKFAKLILKYRKVAKIISTYVDPIIERAEKGGGRVYCTFNTIGATKTGRFSSSGPNLQNQPNTKRMRSCYTASPGYKLVGADFSQIELRLMAHFSQDPLLLKIYNSGELYFTDFGHDPERIVAILNGIIGKSKDIKKFSRVDKRLFTRTSQSEEKPLGEKYPMRIPFFIPLDQIKECVDKLIDAGSKCYFKGGDVHQMTADAANCKRSEAKAVNFGFLYGMYPKRYVNQQLENGNIVSFKDASNYRVAFFETYAGVAAYHKEVQREVDEWGFVTTIVGRRRRLGQALKEDPNKAYRQSVNSRIQGSSADITKIAIRNLARELKKLAKENPIWEKVKMLIQVHDEIICEAPEEIATKLKNLMQHVMENVITLRVPVEADANVGNNWSEVH